MTTRGRSRNLSFALATLASLSAGPGMTAETGTIIAKGGSIELSSTDVQTLLAGLPDDSRKTLRTNLPALEQVVRSEIVQRAVLADARAKNFEHDPNATRQLEHLRQEALTRLWLANKATVPADYPSDAEVKTTYESLRGALPVEYHLAQIFIAAPDGQETSKAAAALRKAVDVGSKLNTADFAQLAREQSEHTESASKGGDLGFVVAERMLPEVAKIIRSLNPGQVAGPVKTSDGVHFIKLIETRPTALPPIADIKQQIVADLRARRGQQLQQAYLNDLAGKLTISINEIELAKLQPGLN